MDATAGITKNDKTPAPPSMPKPGLVLSRDAARLGIGPLRRVVEPWTRPPDDIARGDAAVSARNRLLFSPLALPSLSANGARAGLGPDRTGPDSSGGADVPTRPDAKLSGPVASRVGDDIGEATQLRRARMMGLDRPPDTPRLSANGARAGLGPFVTGSPGDKARADAMAKDLAQSISQLRTNARALLGQASSSIAPIRPLSDSSARAGLTGAGPIAAAAKGFAMRVPQSPVAQDRERWASGTSARIPGALKGLGLAKTDWGDHKGETPPPKRTWVGVQGDATENPYDSITSSDLAQPPHVAVNKSAPLREIEKERAPSPACPPLRMSAEILEAMLRCNAHLAATAPLEILRMWSKRFSLLGLTAPRVRVVLVKPMKPTDGSTAPAKASSCGCSGCGCSGNSVMKPSAPSSARQPLPNPRLGSAGAPVYASPLALLPQSSLGRRANSIAASQRPPAPGTANVARRGRQRKNQGSVRAVATKQPAQPLPKKDCGTMTVPSPKQRQKSTGRGLLSGAPGSAQSTTTLAFLNQLRTRSPLVPKKAPPITAFFARRLHGGR